MRSFLKRYLYLVMGLTITLTACQPEEEPFQEETVPPPEVYTFTAKLGGINWIGTQNVSQLVKNSSGSPSKEMRISASSTDGKLLKLTLSDASTGVAGDGIPLKTYVMQTDGSGDVDFLHINTNTNKTYEGAYGSVVITKCDVVSKKLTGTFSCTLFHVQGDTLKITNGIIIDLPYEITEQ